MLDLVNQKAVSIKGKEIGDNRIVAKMPGKIIKILAKVGDEVKKGQGLIINKGYCTSRYIEGGSGAEYLHI